MREMSAWRRGAAVALSVWCCCLFTVACAGPSTAQNHTSPPPDTFQWVIAASVGAITPQAAYARSARFTPCRRADINTTTTSPDQSVTWLVSGPTVGVGYLRATCSHAFHGSYLYRGFFAVAKGTFEGRQNSWKYGGILEFHKTLFFASTDEPPPPFAPLPPSVADLLPTDRYINWGPWQLAPIDMIVSWTGRAWVSLTPRDYIVALVQENITRPQEASATTVVGLPGWVTEANGMATVVALRPDGRFFVFAGTGSARAIEALAARALPRADDALRAPTQSAITPTSEV
jgi:hypothetical protein